jgi:2-desacetyl-2-hydroxyethyl bacteriochlorophyllide A dehydrogenase
MKAAVYYAPKDIRLQEMEKPIPSTGEVVIEVKACGICGSDLHFYEGIKDVDINPGIILGHELGGEVIEVGKGVKKLKVGDRVGVEPLIGCGNCEYCQVGKYHICPGLQTIGINFHGGFAEYAKAPQEKAYKLPDNVSYEDTTLLDAYAVSVHGINRVRVDVKDVVVVIGSGPLGFTTMQVVKAAGAKEVVLIGRRDENLKIAKKAGADITLNTTKVDVVDEVKKLTNGRGANIVFECVGGLAPTLGQALQMVGPEGIIGIIGAYSEDPVLDFWSGYFKEIDLLWVSSYAKWGGKPEFEIGIDLLALGKCNAKPLVTHKYPLDNITDGFEALLHKKETNAIKVAIIP